MGDSDFIAQAYSLMSDQQILLAYLGEVTPELINAILKGVKKDNTAGFEDDDAMMRKKVYNIIVESLENIARHSEMPEHPSLFMLGKTPTNDYFVVSGNYLLNKQIDTLKHLIEQVNSLDKESIKKVYREVLAEGKISVKGGAGLGIIDMAIKSGNKLEYQFVPVKDDSSFYILKAQISSSN